MIYIALTMGLLSSLHCVGMCGPIALAVPVRTTHTGLKIFRYLLFNSGRVFTYSILGLTAGLAGRGFAWAGLQQWLSILTGIMILMVILFTRYSPHFTPLHNALTGITDFLKKLFARYLKQKGSWSLFILGILNGFLPCGMVYAALLGAIATGDYWSGALFMIAFGLGTTPALMILGLSGNMLGASVRSKIKFISPALAVTVAILLILRGLSLDIPYISPVVNEGKIIKCHACREK
jgi:sulfite exporter TauE/SafE